MTTLCTGHNRAGKPCGKAPIKGATVCRTHGGSAPQVREAAAARVALATAHRTAVALFNDPELAAEDDALASLARMLQSSARMQRVFEMLLSQDPTGTMLEAVDYGNAGGMRSEPVPYLKLHAEWTERTAKIAKLCLDAGVAERQVKAIEAEGAWVVEQILLVFIDIGLTGEKLREGKVAAARRFRVIEGAVAG